MFANVRGRVKNTALPKSQGLLPLFETVINSIDAIEENHKDPGDGKIKIEVLRLASLDMPGNEDDQYYRRPIAGFKIVDNGIGFDAVHFRAFNEADTQVKQNKGGKGIGRFLWLVAFERAEIDSVYEEEGTKKRRRFSFSLAEPDGIGNHFIEEAPVGSPVGTTVQLLGFRDDYEKNVARNPLTIAQRIVEHFLEYMILTKMPVVSLVDGDHEPIRLDQVYEQLVTKYERSLVNVGTHAFDIVHVMLHAHSDLKHHVSYCANRRVVSTVNAGSLIPNLPVRLKDGDNGEFIYAGYVSSDYLDQHVNSQRLGFDAIPQDGFRTPDELTLDEIQTAVIASSRAVLAPYTEAARTKKEDRIREYSVEHPEYRFLVNKYPDRLDAIPPEATDDKLDSYLHDIKRQVGDDLREQGKALQERVLAEDATPSDDVLQEFKKWWEDQNDVGKSALAEYITHRKQVLLLLAKALRRQASGDYCREEVVHGLIFPLKNTSDDIAFEQHNLWLIDEKLAYHRYLASDKRLDQVEVLQSNSKSRPDLLVFFDRAHAVVDADPPYGSGVVIFEFKRPMRGDYAPDENPIEQVLQYVQEIKEGKAMTKDGRPFDIAPGTPFYCYVVCDLTPELRKQAEVRGLVPTPDHMGYIWFNGPLGAYVEVIGFDKLVCDAGKRNRILFDKLNLPKDTSY